MRTFFAVFIDKGKLEAGGPFEERTFNAGGLYIRVHPPTAQFWRNDESNYLICDEEPFFSLGSGGFVEWSNLANISLATFEAATAEARAYAEQMREAIKQEFDRAFEQEAARRGWMNTGIYDAR